MNEKLAKDIIERAIEWVYDGCSSCSGLILAINEYKIISNRQPRLIDQYRWHSQARGRITGFYDITFTDWTRMKKYDRVIIRIARLQAFEPILATFLSE